MTGEELHQVVLSRLEGVSRSGNAHSARCPVHDDHEPSLRVFLNKDGSVRFFCHAGCTHESIVAWLGLTIEQTRPPELRPRPLRLPIREHVYEDADGIATAVKLRWKGRGARFSWRLPDETDGLNGLDPGLYHRPAVEAAVRAPEPVWLAEGERDADTLTAAGLTATTGPHGAGTWKPAYTAVLAGADVAVVADRDRAGVDHARRVAAELTDAGCTVRVLVPPVIANDVTELFEAGGSVGDLEELTDDTDIDAPKVRRTRDGRPAFAQIPGHWVEMLDPHCIKLAVLLDFEQGNAGKPMQGRNRVSKLLGWSYTTLAGHLDHLSEKGIVSIDQRGRKQAVYRVNNPSRARTTERTSGTAADPPVVRQPYHPAATSGTAADPLSSSKGVSEFSVGEGGEDEREGKDPVAGAFPGAVEIDREAP